MKSNKLPIFNSYRVIGVEKRKISIALALKLGKIFQINPSLWLQVQNKNDLKKMKLKNKEKYAHYHYFDLLKKAG